MSVFAMLGQAVKVRIGKTMLGQLVPS